MFKHSHLREESEMVNLDFVDVLLPGGPLAHGDETRTTGLEVVLGRAVVRVCQPVGLLLDEERQETRLVINGAACPEEMEVALSRSGVAWAGVCVFNHRLVSINVRHG